MVKKLCIVGRGEPSKRQIELLKKAIGEFEVVNKIEQLTSVEQLRGCEVVFSFVLHPDVLRLLQQAWEQGMIVEYYVPKTTAIKTEVLPNDTDPREYCSQHDADVVNAKVLPNGEISVRCLQTEYLMKNPMLLLKYEIVQ